MLENRNKGKLLSIHSSLSRLYFAIDRPCQLFVLAVQTADRCAWRERRRRNEEGAWHTHDTLVATHRALCTGIRHKADERDPPSVERVSETRCTRLDTEENGWKSRADLRQLLVRKVQYVYNNHYFITIFWYTKMLFNNWEFTRRAISFLGINKNKTNLHAKNSKNKRRVFLF